MIGLASWLPMFDWMVLNSTLHETGKLAFFSHGVLLRFESDNKCQVTTYNRELSKISSSLSFFISQLNYHWNWKTLPEPHKVRLDKIRTIITIRTTPTSIPLYPVVALLEKFAKKVILNLGKTFIIALFIIENKNMELPKHFHFI